MKLKSYAAKTDQGPYLQVNEDGMDIDLVNDLYMLLDGYGGAAIGDKCVASLKENIRNFFTRITLDPDSTMPFFYGHKYLLEGNAIINAIYFAHKLMYKENKKRDMSRRAGASIIAAALSEKIITLVSSGNIICYLYRQGELVKIINEDSIETLINSAPECPLQVTPLSGVGLFEDIYLQTKEVRLKNNDLFIIMTDGVYLRMKDIELKQLIESNFLNLSLIVDKSMELVNSRGNLDNQSMLLLQF